MTWRTQEPLTLSAPRSSARRHFIKNADIIFLERKKGKENIIASDLMVDKIIINGCLCTNLPEDYDIMPMLSQVLYKEQGIDMQHMNSMFLILVR
jgi:hypothetical protein